MNTIADRALRAHDLAEELADLLLGLENPEDLGRLAQRAVVGIVMEAAGVVSVEQDGTVRRWEFEDGHVIYEEMAVVMESEMYNPSLKFLIDG